MMETGYLSDALRARMRFLYCIVGGALGGKVGRQWVSWGYECSEACRASHWASEGACSCRGPFWRPSACGPGPISGVIQIPNNYPRKCVMTEGKGDAHTTDQQGSVSCMHPVWTVICDHADDDLAFSHPFPNPSNPQKSLTLCFFIRQPFGYH